MSDLDIFEQLDQIAIPKDDDVFNELDTIAIPQIIGGDGENYTGSAGQTQESPEKKEIHESMWDDNNPATGEPWLYKDALKKYNEYAEREDTKLIKGVLTQVSEDGSRPVIIPHPEESGGFLTKQETNLLSNIPLVMPGGIVVPPKIKSKEEIEEIEKEKATIDPEADATTGIFQKTYDALLDTGGEMVMTGTALTDVIFGTNFTESQRQQWPNANTENLGDLIWVEATPIAGAYGVGRKLIFKSVEGATKAIQYTKKFLNELMGTFLLASGTELETGGLLVGEKSLFDAIEGFNFGDKASEQKLAQIFNLTMDAFVSAGIFNAVTYAPAAIINVTNHGLAQPILNLFRGEAGTKSRIIDSLLQEASGSYKTKAEFMEAKLRMAQIIKDNKEFFVELSKKDPSKNLNLSLDVATSLKQQLGKNAETDRLILPMIEILESKMKGLNPSGVNKPQTNILTGSESALEEIIETGAGTTAKSQDELAIASQDAAEVITGKSKTELDDALNVRQTQIQNLDELEKSILERAKTDPEYGSKIDGLTTKLGEDPTEVFTKAELGVDIGFDLNRAAEVLTNKKNTLFNKISGGSIDPEGLFTILKEIKDIGTFTEMTSKISSSKPLSSILKIFDKKKITETIDGKKTTRPATEDDHYDELLKVLKKNKIDFGKLHNEIRPEIVALIDEARGPIQNELINFKRFIDDDSLQYLFNTSQGELAADVLDAMRFYSDEFAPYFRQGDQDALTIWYNTWEKTAKAKKPSYSLDAGEFLMPRAYNEGTLEMLNNISQSSSLKAETFGDVASLIRTSNPENAKNLYNFIMHDVLIKAQNVITSSGGVAEISKQGVNDLAIGLAKIGEALRMGKFTDEADQLDDFIRSLNTNTNNIDEAKRLIDEATENAKTARDAMLNSELKMFWKAAKKDGLDIDVVATSEPDQAFMQLFKSEGQILDRVNKVMAMAEDNPVVLDALRSSYAKYLHTMIFGSGQTVSKTRTVKLQQIDDRLTKFDTILKAGDEIFKDSVGVYGPETMQGLREIVDLVRGIELARRGSSAGVSQTAYANLARGAVANLTKIFLGPLTRPGARISAVTSSLINKIQPDEMVLRLTEDLLQNPEEFSRLLKKSVNWMSDETQDIMFRSFVRAGLYSDDDKKEFEGVYNVLLEGAGILEDTYNTVTTPIKKGINIGKNLFSGLVSPQ